MSHDARHGSRRRENLVSQRRRVCTKTSARGPGAGHRHLLGVDHCTQTRSKEIAVLIALAVLLLVLAVIGGLTVHPLLFLLVILAALALFGGRRGTVL